MVLQRWRRLPLLLHRLGWLLLLYLRLLLLRHRPRMLLRKLLRRMLLVLNWLLERLLRLRVYLVGSHCHWLGDCCCGVCCLLRVALLWLAAGPVSCKQRLFQSIIKIWINLMFCMYCSCRSVRMLYAAGLQLLLDSRHICSVLACC
jgi:hypothetical protein